MPNCSVISCPNDFRKMRKKDGVSYFSFPRNPIRCAEWTVIIAKARNEVNYKPYKGSVVCSYHFPASDIYTTTKGYSRLHRNAKPILHLSKKQHESNDNSDQETTHDNSDHDYKQQSIEQNEESIELHSNENNSRKIAPSPATSLNFESILNTARETVMKRKLKLYEKMIRNKNRHINRLQKQNKRLIKKNATLKDSIKVLKNYVLE